MMGAIVGDIVGSVYEFNNINTKSFPIFSEESRFTDDTVITLAVADGLMNALGKSDAETRLEVIKSMRAFGQAYPFVGYGQKFFRWIASSAVMPPYNSYGNGAAMRVSSAGWLYDTVEDVLKYAKITAMPTHDHPEGIKGAMATAHAIFLSRTGSSKNEIKSSIEKEYGYELNKTVRSITKIGHGPETCQVTVPEAMICFIEGNSFEEVLANAVSVGGDSDTVGAIAGSIAEAYYGIPYHIKEEAISYLDDSLLEVVARFAVLMDSKDEDA